MGIFDKLFKKPAPRDRIARETIDLSPPGVEGNVTYRNIDFVDCDFIMSDRWPQFLTDCTFQSCRFTLEKSLRGFGTRNAVFTNCEFHFKRASNWRAIHGEQFEDCRFTGRLTGSRFGHLETDDDILGGDQTAFLKHCDFSALKMDDIEFHGANPLADCQLPGWPVIGYVNPDEKTPLPDAIKALPERFHYKCCTSVHRRNSVYVVNIERLGIDRTIMEKIAQNTGRIEIFGD